MPGTHHKRVHHPGSYHAGYHNYHIPPSLPGLKPSPVNPVFKDQQMQDQYNSWTESPLTLQVVDKVGVPILETQVTRDTTVDEIRALVTTKVRERHDDALKTPVLKDGNKHRTYTALTDVGIYKVANSNDAYSGILRELQFGQRLDGCTERKYESCILRMCCCHYDQPLRIGLVFSPQQPQSILKLLFSSSLQRAVSRSSHRKSWKSNSWYENSFDSPSPVSAGSPGGSDGSGGSGGSGGGGGGSG